MSLFISVCFDKTIKAGCLTNMNKAKINYQQIIDFIKTNDSYYSHVDLSGYSIEHLVIIKTRIEIEKAEKQL